MDYTKEKYKKIVNTKIKDKPFALGMYSFVMFLMFVPPGGRNPPASSQRYLQRMSNAMILLVQEEKILLARKEEILLSQEARALAHEEDPLRLRRPAK